ncbi:unnamed protein product [Ectocarpus sp. 6 AP-2014]
MNLFTRLMDAGADGSAGWRGCHGRTLLGAAAYGKNEEIVERLLAEDGAAEDVNVCFGDRLESALHVAAGRDDQHLSRVLLIAGADPNLLDDVGRSPLHVAADKGHHRVLGFLLRKGRADANKTTLDTLKCTPLYLAANNGHTSCVSKLLLYGADTDCGDRFENTPLCAAATGNHVEVVKLLLAAGADLDIRPDAGMCALDLAALNGNADVVRILLGNGADVNAWNDDDWATALHCAAQGSRPRLENGDVIRVLLEAGADIHATTKECVLTPLHRGVYSRLSSLDTIHALLEGGADVNAQAENTWTPLHYACYKSNAAAVDLLLRWGADDTIVDGEGETAADEVGTWDPEVHSNEDDGSIDDDQLKADGQRTRLILACAPVDRLWRRRGWLVLCRSYPTKVQILKDSSSSSSGCSTAKAARVSEEDSGECGEDDGDKARIELGRLVGHIVGLQADVVFRMVVGYI